LKAAKEEQTQLELDRENSEKDIENYRKKKTKEEKEGQNVVSRIKDL